MTRVEISKEAQKDLLKVPRNIQVKFYLWSQTIKKDGYFKMQQMKGYRDHSLHGDRASERASCLSKSYRVIYKKIDEHTGLIINVLEVNKHEYKK